MASLTNIIGYALCVIGFGLLGFVRGNEHWRPSTLVVGIAMVALGTLAVGLFSDLSTFFDAIHESHRIDETAREQGKAVTELWVFVFPAVVLAIGANLITAWVLSKKPS